MTKLNLILTTIGALIFGVFSFILMRKNQKIEDMYDDLLDAKAELKLKDVELKLIDKRKAYNEAIKKYTAAVLKHNALDVVFVMEPSTSGGTEPGERPDSAAASLRPGTKILH